MDRIGSFEAKTHLSKLLDRVAKGESIVITKHGLAVARLVPTDPNTRTDVARTVEELEECQTVLRLNPTDAEPISVRELIEDGRKW